MRRLFGCPDIVSLTEKSLMARNFSEFLLKIIPHGDPKKYNMPDVNRLICYLVQLFDQKLFVFLSYFFPVMIKVKKEKLTT